MESIRLTQIENKEEKKEEKVTNQEEFIETLDEWRENIKKREIQRNKSSNHNSSPYIVASEIPSVQTAEFVMTSQQGSGYDVTNSKNYFDEILLRGRSDDVSGDNFLLLSNYDVEDNHDITEHRDDIANSSRVAMATYVENFGSASDENKSLLPPSVDAYIGEDVLR